MTNYLPSFQKKFAGRNGEYRLSLTKFNAALVVFFGTFGI